MIRAKKIIICCLLLSIASFSFSGYVIFNELKPAELKLLFFDIGQGDSILIQTPGKKNILIDGGPDNQIVYKLGGYLPFYEREIDLMILTHPHADHVVGLVEVLKRYEVKRIITTGVDYYSADYGAWQAEINRQQIQTTIIDRIGKMELEKDIYFEFIFPGISLEDKKIENVNNASIVARLVYGKTSVMLTGDYEDEEKLVEKGLALESDILKVGHHGSNTANDPVFLQKTNAQIAVISAGEGNKFNHPHQETLENLEKLNVRVLRTDLAGDILFCSDGKTFRPGGD